MQTSAAATTDPKRARDRRDADAVARAYAPASLARYTFKERLLIRAADLVFSLLIRLLGASARFRVEGWENFEAASRDASRPPVYTFWHEQILLGTYFFRDRRIVVMTSQS
ncbi:MAG: hypothetical protein LC746_18920, partial [Acidobacteria bacterium]|nr:hypothetical protein [Acidobacteriota bacterium]